MHTNYSTVVELYLELNNAFQSPACVISKSGEVLHVNKHLMSLLGYEVMKDRKIFELHPNISVLDWRERWEKLSNLDRISGSTILMKHNGEIFNINFWSKKVDTDEGTIVLIIYQTENDLEEVVSTTTMSEMLAYTIESIDEMIFWIDREGNLVHFNEALSTTTGFSDEQLMQMKAWEFSSEVTTEQEWKAFVEKVKNTDGAHVVETKQLRQDGSSIFVEATSKYIQFKDKEYVFSVVRNITERKKRMQLLEQMKYSLDYAVDMVVWLSEDGRILYANHTLAKKIGYTVEELKEYISWEVAPNVTKENWQTRIVDNFKDGDIKPYESQLITKNGQTIFVEVSGTSLKFENELYIIAIIRDLTERNEYEAKLKNTIQKLKNVKAQLEEERTYLQEEISVQYSFDEIITQNKAYKNVLAKIPQVADTNATVLITGETGTGKELLARAVHNLSARANENLVKINCAAIPEHLIESELFGHKKGAFTSAYQDKIGRFELAHKGTIFLDEIGEMPLELQAKLLRVLQEGEFEPLGSVKTVKVDVRVIAATNRNLLNRVQEGHFREDLYYRLNVFPIENMPLRDRKDDIPILVNYFVEKYCKRLGRPLLKVSQAGVKKLMAYNFPGNIRELENIVERAIILSKGEVLNLKDIIPSSKNRVQYNSNEFLSFDEMQKQYIIEALNKTDWKVSGKNSASELLNLNGKTLASKIRKFKIERP